jgi:hypothetical protein
MADLTFPITTKISGVSYCQKNIERGVFRSSVFRLHREPENIHDENAIYVTANYFRIGYIPRDLAQDVAPLLDAGIDLLAKFVRKNVSSKAENATVGVTIEIYRRG